MKLFAAQLLPTLVLAALGAASGQRVNPVSNSNSGIVSSIINTFTRGNCNDHINLFNRPAGDVCAILFDESNCRGEKEVVGQGYTVLDELDDDAESVLVRPGCTLTGHDRTRANIFGQGDNVVVDNTAGGSFSRNEPRLKNLRGDDDVEEDISAVDCTCPVSVRRPQQQQRQFNEPSRIAGPAQGNAANERNCKTAFNAGNSADCIMYDDEDCKVEDWDSPLVLTRGQERAFKILDSFSLRNTIESVSVRAGCSLHVYDDSAFGKDDQGIDDQYTFVAPKEAHLHVTLDESTNLIVRALDDDINSVKCLCP